MVKRIGLTLLIAAILTVPSLMPSLTLGQEQLQKTAINTVKRIRFDMFNSSPTPES